MPYTPNNSHPQNGINHNAFEANATTPCPLCDRDHYCYLVTQGEEVIKSVCQWTEEAPQGWHRSGTARDGRGIFTRNGVRGKRRHYPDYVELVLRELSEPPQWQDIVLTVEDLQKGHKVTQKGFPDTPLTVKDVDWSKRQVIIEFGLDTYRRRFDEIQEILTRDLKTGAKEQVIYYEYPAVDRSPLGRVVRKQWTDRRKVYKERGSLKSKQIRPEHWIGTPQEGVWSSQGKGTRDWPLYREQEAKEEILRGGIVFAVGGEQAVETYRSLGLVAVTCQGGESNWKQIPDRLKEVFMDARELQLKPLLVIHPDNDITGDSKFGEQLLRECDRVKISAVCLDPLQLWRDMPVGGDIHDWVQSNQLPNEILRQLENCIDEAIDRKELEIEGRKQRARWQAPESWQGELGFWREVRQRGEEPELVFKPACDFDFQIERELVSEDGGGLMLQVKRTDDRSQRRVYLKSTDYSSCQKFKDALKKGIGGGIVCTLNDHQLQALIRVRLHEYRLTRQGKAYRLINRIGQQADGTWVFKHCQFTRTGEPTHEEQSLWVWNNEICGEEGSFRPPAIAPQSPEAIKILVSTLKRATGSNFYPTLLVLGYGAAGVHYQEIQEIEGAFPLMNLYGDPGSGKTTAAEGALSMVGQHKEGVMRSVSVSAAYERLKLAGGLLHCLDDPERTPDLDEFLKGFYNGNSRVVRGREAQGFNIQKPHSPLMVTSNHACGENSAATQSRLVRLFFPKIGDGDRQAFRELPTAYQSASGALTQLIQIGYPVSEINALELELAEYLPHAHQRIAKSLALVLYYAMRVADLAGEDVVPLKTYVRDVVCTTVNDPDEAGDSLRDFLEKLFVLQSEAKVGEWNVRWTDPRDGKEPTLAIYLPGVWAQMDKSFSPAYNRKIIEALLLSRGIQKSRQRFHANEDESRAYRRAKLSLSSGIDPNPPETTVRWCYEVPRSWLSDLSEKAGGHISRSTRSQGGVDSPQTVMDSEIEVCTNGDQQRSTDVHTFGSLDTKFQSVDQQDFLDQQTLYTPQVQSGQGLEPSPDPLCTLLIEKCTPSEIKHQIGVQSPLPDVPVLTEVYKLAQSAQVGVGVMVVPIDTARWIRAQDVTKLPWRDLAPSLKDAKEIPLNQMPEQVSAEIRQPSKVLRLSRDRRKILVINQQSGRKSLFYTDDVEVVSDALG